MLVIGLLRQRVMEVSLEFYNNADLTLSGQLPKAESDQPKVAQLPKAETKFIFKKMDSQLLEFLVNSNIDFNAITKKGILLKAVQAKIDNPKETKKNIANNLNVSTKTLQRYANEFNFTDFKKQKNKTVFEPVKCDHCEFISKSVPGLKSHERAKHLDKIVTIKDQNQISLSENVSKNYKKN